MVRRYEVMAIRGYGEFDCFADLLTYRAVSVRVISRQRGNRLPVTSTGRFVQLHDVGGSGIH